MPPSKPTPEHVAILRLVETGIDTAGRIAAVIAVGKPKTTTWATRAGTWRAVGATLSTLKKRGWVTFTVSDHGQKEWTLTTQGRAFLNQTIHPN